MFAWVVWHLRVAVGYFRLPALLVKWTGKSRQAVDPKHLLSNTTHHWYLEHLTLDSVVLDVGCGNAMHSIACAPECRLICGFDHNWEQLRMGQSLTRGRRLGNIHLTVGDAEDRWAFASGCFDKVLLLDVLEHLTERDFALQEAKRVLRADGMAVLSVPNRDTSWKRLRRDTGLFAYADQDHKIEYTRQGIEDALARHGFSCISIAPVVFDTPWDWAINLIGGVSLGWYERLVEWKRNKVLQYPDESTGFRIVAQVSADDEASG